MSLDFSSPRVMGILNVTPDSFSDGGQYVTLDSALRQVEVMVQDGADIIDIGGESTRPGAQQVSEQEELDRVIPLITAIRQRFSVPISIDTSKADVMTEAVAAGANMINDVCALQGEGALKAAANTQVPICLMHMQGEPRTMQTEPKYNDVVSEVLAFLSRRIEACGEVGISRDRLLVDPGFGFGKTVPHNLELLKKLNRFDELGVPVLVGLSRKSMIGAILDKPVEQRLYGSLAGVALSVWQGASVIRVHDVAATVDVVRFCRAVMQGSSYL